jgi:hypothetical protein
MRKLRASRDEDALAQFVLDRYLHVRRGESLTIESWSQALPWARPFVVAARRRGVHPTLVVEDEGAFFRSLEASGSRSVLRTRRTANDFSDAQVYLGGPEEFSRLLGLPADDLEALTDRGDGAWWPSARGPHTRSVRLAVADATLPAATRYGVDAASWTAELLLASLVDPEQIARSGHRLLRSLGRRRRLRVRHPNGSELRLERGPGLPEVASGPPPATPGSGWGQAPSGLLILPLRADVAEGSWESNRPAYDRFADPPLALGGRFEFRGGRLEEFSFDRGGERFASAYGRAGRGRDRPTALTIGLNPEISQAPEVLEYGAGTVGLLLGDSPRRRGFRRSGFSFLATLAEADVEADERPWLRAGAPPARLRRRTR